MAAGVAVCHLCGAAVPTLPEGLFRDDTASPPTPAAETTTPFTPDFVVPPHPLGLAAQPPAAPELPPDLFREDASPAPEDVFTAAHDPVFDTATGSFGFRQLGAAETAAIPVTRAAVPLAAPLPSAAAAPAAVPPAPIGRSETDLLPSERSLELPDPVRGRSGVVLLAILALLVVTALIGGLLWWNSGTPPTAGTVATGRTSATPSRSATASAPASASEGQPSAATSSTTSAPVPSPSGTVAFPPARAKECTNGVAVNEATSCPFALVVAAELPTLAEGETTTISATSPTTGQKYQMTCRRAGYVTCTGGTNAVVYVKVDV